MPIGPYNLIELNRFKEDKKKEGYIIDCPKCGCKANDLELEYFCSSDNSWMSLCGREGYNLVCPKCGHQIKTFIICMS